jgi:Uncharacterized protein conserved in bacteria
MILLLDANLSWRLVNLLKPTFGEVWHVDETALKSPAKDYEIWEFARLHDAVIVTNDEDFYKLSVFKGFPPKVVILRTSNQSNNYIAQVLIKHVDDIVRFHGKDDYGILEIM